MDALARCFAEMEEADAELRQATRELVDLPGLQVIPDDVFTRLSRRKSSPIDGRTFNLNAGAR